MTAYTQENQNMQYSKKKKKKHQVYRVERKGAGRLGHRLESHHETNGWRDHRTE